MNRARGEKLHEILYVFESLAKAGREFGLTPEEADRKAAKFLLAALGYPATEIVEFVDREFPATQQGGAGIRPQEQTHEPVSNKNEEK